MNTTYYDQLPVHQVQKEIDQMDKRIQRLNQVGLNEMGANGHRSTRKATANFAIGQFTELKWKFERYLTQRKLSKK